VTVDLDDSFIDNINGLPEQAQRQIGRIVKRLEEDPYYLPNDDCYLTHRHPNGSPAACRHLTDWDGWLMLWYFDYVADFPTTISTVVVMLSREPLQLVPLFPKQIQGATVGG
jgi:hypothetical protein